MVARTVTNATTFLEGIKNLSVASGKDRAVQVKTSFLPSLVSIFEEASSLYATQLANSQVEWHHGIDLLRLNPYSSEQRPPPLTLIAQETPTSEKRDVQRFIPRLDEALLHLGKGPDFGDRAGELRSDGSSCAAIVQRPTQQPG